MSSGMSSFACILSLIFMLLCAVAVNGCPGDSDTSHTEAERNGQRLYSYTSTTPARASTSNELRFMTFNQRSGFTGSNCKSDVPTQAGLIRDNADYIGTQETVQNVDSRCSGCNIPQMIANIAGMSTRFVMAIPWRTGQYGISAGTSQIVLETKYITMPYSGYETRAAVALKTQPLFLQGKYLWFIDIHIEYYSLIVRQSQIAQILSFVDNILASDPQAVIVMAGDFNGGPWDPVYGTMKLSGFKNSWEVFNGGSFLLGNTIPADWPEARFDHVWYKAPSTVSVTVKKAEVHNVQLSDHRPYTATLAFSLPNAPAPTPVPATVRPPTAPTTRPDSPATVAPTVPAVVESVVCVGPIWEGVPVTITCPLPAQKMTTVQFASYGTATGTCGNFKLGNCIGGSSTAVVVDKCLNRNTCSFPINNNVFGDPCPRTGKHFYAQVLCK